MTLSIRYMEAPVVSLTAERCVSLASNHILMKKARQALMHWMTRSFGVGLKVRVLLRELD